MPLFRNLRPDQAIVLPTIAGPYGESRDAGLLIHRYTYDMSGQPSQTGNIVNIFEPSAAILPLVIFRVLLRWELDDANSDNTFVQIGGTTIDDLLRVGNFLDDDDNGTVWGRQANQSNTGTAMISSAGATSHEHWEHPTTVLVGTPLRMNVDTQFATAGPYSGKLYVNILYASLA